MQFRRAALAVRLPHHGIYGFVDFEQTLLGRSEELGPVQPLHVCI